MRVSTLGTLRNAIRSNALIDVVSDINYDDSEDAVVIEYVTGLTITSSTGAVFNGMSESHLRNTPLFWIKSSDVTFSGVGFQNSYLKDTYGTILPGAGCMKIEGRHGHYDDDEYNLPPSHVEIHDSFFKSCTVDQLSFVGGGSSSGGGAINAFGSTLKMRRVDFIDCESKKATAGGGGVRMLHVEADFAQVSFKSCTAPHDTNSIAGATDETGGAIFAESSTFTLTDLAVEGNVPDDVHNFRENTFTCQSSCAVGQHCGSKENAVVSGTHCLECPVNCEPQCFNCSAGRGGAAAGATSDEACAACGVGYFSPGKGGECQTCPAGKVRVNAHTRHTPYALAHVHAQA